MKLRVVGFSIDVDEKWCNADTPPLDARDLTNPKCDYVWCNKPAVYQTASKFNVEADYNCGYMGCNRPIYFCESCFRRHKLLLFRNIANLARISYTFYCKQKYVPTLLLQKGRRVRAYTSGIDAFYHFKSYGVVVE